MDTHGGGDDDEEFMEEDETEQNEGSNASKAGTLVYLPGSKELEEGEELVCDKTAYVMYHQAHTGAPCLSFDILPDSLGENRETFPMTCYIVCGTQAERSHANSVIVLKMTNLSKVKPEEEDESESEEEEDEEDGNEPKLGAAMIKHQGSVNRLRSTILGGRHVAATWSETGKVHIWDLTQPLNAVNDSAAMARYQNQDQSSAAQAQSLHSFAGHQAEGFAIDWSPTTPGQLLSGDCTKNIHLWTLHEGNWIVDQRPFVGHTASVEDIQWSPNEKTVFCSCSVDRSLRVWDVRAAPSKACMLTVAEAHARDVNCIHWNRNDPFLVSGGDDGALKIWDLRQFKNGQAVATFKHHTSPITSVEWHPSDSTVFAASGSDDQITIWDLAVERDEEAGGDEELPDVPPQLLFIHQGQTDIKELHWHKQLPGVILSTAHSGFDVFRTISV